MNKTLEPRSTLPTSATRAWYASFKNFLLCLAGSTFLWILAAIVSFDVLLDCVRPLRYLQIGAYIPSDQNPIGYKYMRLAQPLRQPDVLVFGASLVNHAAACADALYHKSPAPHLGYEINSYIRADYLESLLTKAAKRPVTVFNFAGTGCVACDEWLLLSKSLEAGKKPKMVVFAISPREFVNNEAVPTAKSTYFDYFAKNNGLAFLEPDMSFDRRMQLLLSRMWYYFKIKQDYNILLTNLICQVSHRKSTLYDAVNSDPEQPADLTAVKVLFASPAKRADEDMPLSYKQWHLHHYKEVFNPLNKQRFKIEFEYFNKALALCKEKSIACIVINLPLPPSTRDLLPQSSSCLFLDNLRSSCALNNAHLIDLGSHPSFTEMEFRDSVHPLGPAGKRTWDMMVEQLAQDPKLLGRL